MSSVVTADHPKYQQLANILTAQKTAIENAFRRKGERPKDLPPHARCVNEYTMASLSNKMRSMQTGHMLAITVIGNPYPPSVASFIDLKKLMIKDLMLETNHRGYYLLLRFICPAMRISGVMNIVEDEAGTVTPFALYLQEPETVRTAESILKDKGVIIVKEPYFKLGTGGQYVIRVDQPTDIVWVSEDDSRIPTKWRVANVSIQQSAVHWKKKGNDLVTKGKFFDAIEMYSRALRSSPTLQETEILHNNKALANLRIEAFDAAFDDVSFISNPQDRSEKGLYRGALALYGLGRYKEAIEVLEILLRKYPDSVPGKDELDRSRLRFAEQQSGVYDFKTLYKAAKLRPPRMDNASYQGPVEVRESKGRGRGLFTTRSVEAGELMLCEKAFSYCFATPPEEMAKASSKSLSYSSCLIDVPGKRTSIGTHADLIRDISNKLALNPSLGSCFENLFHGNYEGITGISVDGTRVVDTFLVAKAVHLNSFSCPLTSRDSIEDPELDRASNYTPVKQHKDSSLSTTGVWILASYINHSCDPTCMRSFIGDLQIVRAARDMPANTELTFSYITRDAPGKMNQTLSIGWGFQCDCAICVDDRKTPPALKVQRRKLIKGFFALSTSVKRKEDIINQLGTTYQHPSSEVPRLQMWKVHFSLAQEFAKRPETDKLIEQVLAAFKSVGFVIEGARLSPSPSSTIVVRKWGFPHEGTTSAWLTLRNVYRSVGMHNLAEQAKEFARITWMLLVGEDTTFVYDNPPTA
ncbi:hypothetical protein EG329_003250 [Mollisiaceae sp. DMI_Dod_QoI]|nr:hypothetical protein EG329_003250 [Helotiales sp. DMI_Dod_QoI]